MRVLVSGGGTGGHIYPALALIDEIKKKRPDAEFLYVGTTKGLESKIVPNAGIPFKTIEIQGFKRSLSPENFKTIYLFLKSVHDSKQIIKEFKPDIVIGTGGYVCGAVVYAAAKLKVKTIIHEQNSVAGVTNKFLSHYVDKIGICFEDVKKEFPTKKVVFTGNPRAQQVANMRPSDRLKEYGLDPNKKTVLIFGGSRGALGINQASLAALDSFKDQPYQVLFVTGRVHFDDIMARLKGKKLPQNVVIEPYIADMPALLPEITMIVGRAGATSLAEITALGIPSLLIPSPYVTHDHQTKNAQSLVKKDAALMLRESELDEKTLFAKIHLIMNDENRQVQMAKNAKAAGVPDASDRLLQVIDELIAQK